MTALADYIDNLGDLPTELLLGRVVLFTITDEPISRTSLVEWFDELGIDQRYLPPPNKRQHAFEKATSDATGASYPMTRGRIGRLMCRPVSKGRDRVIRQVTREVQDANRRKLGYDEAITVTFYRPSDPGDQSTARVLITVNPDALEPEEIEPIRRAARDIKARYERYYDFLDGQKTRATVRNCLRGLNAIEIKGGVYFIHANRDEELSRLRELVTRLGGGCHMDQVPIVDVEAQREFITRAFEREASQALQDLIRDSRELLASRRNITPAAYARMKERYDEVVENATEHVLKLRTSQDITAASATVALRVLGELQEAMLSGR